MAQLEAEIARLKEALRQRQQIGVATGLWPHASRSLLSSMHAHCRRILTTKTVALLTQNWGRQGPAMTGPQWLLLIGIAVTLLFTWLLLIDAVARGRPKGKMLRLAAAYRRFSSSGALPDRNQGCG